jgi:D-amino-acid dehydrogenase
MLGVARDIFPDGGDFEQPAYRACLRPMTPEGTPRFGLGRQRNLYYNAGHGHMGWTMACGAARITADLIAGRQPEIPLDGMTLQ